MSIKYNKELAINEAVRLNKKFREETIWTQALLEGEVLSYDTVCRYFDSCVSQKTPIDKIFQKEDNYSVFTIKLLEALKAGWDYYDQLFEKDKDYMDLDNLIELNFILTKCNVQQKYGLRGDAPARIIGTHYIPETPVYSNEINQKLESIWFNTSMSDLDKGLELFCFGCKRQIFSDGNKRTSLLSSTFYLCKAGVANQFYVRKEKLQLFISHLIAFYEDDSKKESFKKFLKENCISYTTEFQKTDEYKSLVSNTDVDIQNKVCLTNEK